MMRSWWRLRWHLWERWQPLPRAIATLDACSPPAEQERGLWVPGDVDEIEYLERMFGGEDGRE
jgi:hypothetical protein